MVNYLKDGILSHNCAVELLNEASWARTSQELDRPNPELAGTATNPAHNCSYWVEGLLQVGSAK